MSYRPNLGPDAWPHRDPGPNGERYCRFCGRQVTGRRESWCGNICVHEYRVRREPGYARKCVELRDRGRCAICRFDTARLDRVLTRLRDAYKAAWLTDVARARQLRERLRAVGVAAAARGFDVVVTSWPTGAISAAWRALWQADHAAPLAEGGLEVVRRDGLRAFRTLCTPCHQAETNALNARLRAQRAALSGRTSETLAAVLRRQSGG